MPPKQRFSSEDVIAAAFNVVRQHGWQGLSARAIAKELNASTRPIYDHLKSMKNIEKGVVKKALAMYVEYIGRDRTGDKWLDQALGYVLFAKNEKHLFRCINDEEHVQYQREFAKQHWAALGEQLTDDARFKDLPDNIKNRIRVVRWFLLHGISYLVSNGWLELPDGEDTMLYDTFAGISLTDFLDKANNAIYEGFKK